MAVVALHNILRTTTPLIAVPYAYHMGLLIISLWLLLRLTRRSSP